MVAPDSFQAAITSETYGSIVRIRNLCSVSVIVQRGSSFTLAMETELVSLLLVSSFEKIYRLLEGSCSRVHGFI